MRLVVVSAAVLLAAGACRGGEDTGPREPRRVPVEVAVVETGEFAEVVAGIGTVEAGETVELRAEQPGRLEAVHFEEGTEVEAGQLLFTLDAEVLKSRRQALQAGLAGARAQRAEASRNARRLRTLYRRELAARARYEEARTQASAAAAEVRRIESEIAALAEQVGDARIEAPFAGWISERQADPGDFVTAGQPLATLYRSGEPRVAFSVPERSAPKIAIGQPVRIYPAGTAETAVDGRVSFIAPAVQSITRDVLIRADLDDANAKLRPGQFTRIEVVVTRHEDRPFVPEEALVGTRDGYIVYVVEAGEAVRRPVAIGLREPGRAEIREGLRAGERVITAGQLSVEAGDPVQVVRERDGAPPAEREVPPDGAREPGEPQAPRSEVPASASRAPSAPAERTPTSLVRATADPAESTPA